LIIFNNTHTFVRTPLDERSVRHRELYLTTHNTHNRHTSMSSQGFEPAIPASGGADLCLYTDRPQW